MVDVSLAMIAKDEAARIGAALESVQRLRWVRDLVVLDTGSQDATREIAASLGARVFKESIVPWDFSAARNRAAELCRHNTILVLDADEVISDAGDLLEVIKESNAPTGVRAIVTPFYDGAAGPTMAQVRVYDREHGRWRYPVHNQLVVAGVVDSTARIEAHYDGAKDRGGREAALDERGRRLPR